MISIQKAIVVGVVHEGLRKDISQQLRRPIKKGGKFGLTLGSTPRAEVLRKRVEGFMKNY